ncbi:MAG: spore cortex-lytic enzyme [Lachnospiraceae bacterium]|nr:spore cortex-lytic enzyme [Lachnospiraceae bacterium]
MKFGKREIGCISIVGLMLGLFLGAMVNPTVKTDTGVARNDSAVAGVIANVDFPVEQEANVAVMKVNLVSETMEGAAEEEVPAEEEPQVTTEEPEEVSYWDSHLVVKVDESLNVRSRASKNAKLVGKMFPKNGAKILKETGNWYKIKSGNLRGFVKASYCLTGKKAERYAKKHGMYRATALSGGLRIRSKASTDGKIYTVVDKGSSIATAKRPCKVEGWVAVNYKGKRAFVSEEYVKVSLRTSKGMTMKEYNAKLAKEAAAKKAAEEAARTQRSSRSTESTTTTQQSSVDANVDDVTLLAALIQCEAGTQNYQGQLAVGAVVCNRIRSGRYPNSLRGVIYQRGQFGPAHSGILARRLNGTIASSCYRAARAALGGEDNVGGALHFQSVRTGIQGLVIGGHVFF